MKGTRVAIGDILIDADFKTSQEALSVMAGILVDQGFANRVLQMRF